MWPRATQTGLINVRYWAPELGSLQCLTRQYPTHPTRNSLHYMGLDRTSKKFSSRIRGKAFGSRFARIGHEGPLRLSVPGSSRSALIAEMPRPSRPRWGHGIAFGPHASRRLGPIPKTGSHRFAECFTGTHCPSSMW